jgi:hypothetical protein
MVEHISKTHQTYSMHTSQQCWRLLKNGGVWKFGAEYAHSKHAREDGREMEIRKVEIPSQRKGAAFG